MRGPYRLYIRPITCYELLDMDNSITMHQRNLQRLATEMYKVKNNISPIPMQELFTAQVNTHDLRNKRCWNIPNARSVGCGTETIRGSKTWEQYQLKAMIKCWKPEGCTCRLCKTHVDN